MHEPLHIKLVHPAQRGQFSKSLMQMHRDRKRVFVDRLGWRLPSGSGWLEVDEFDDDYAIYLLAVSADDEHLGSLRLLPTTRPHMLAKVFSHLCPGGPPTGNDVWEISRFLANPDHPSGTAILRVYRILAGALIEFAGLNGVNRFTFVAESKRMPALLSIGWTVLPLGLPTLIGGELVEAAEIVLREPAAPACGARNAAADLALETAA